ncbi:zinc ABC transporter substrate-binding protein [Campylobacter coli]|uniref:metal ABC transporter solute-binding protein, Zn/Mn family n=1 Tax=Campylobacter coli TaxID=195 RepID=UPI000777CB31|nr:zinc ABC transporter substrate-binding protein [Campylobacter coli]EAI5368403.1 ABC transporter substrate-binding protein [Campylobacter coli]EAJ4488956.1 ABC transporter substrate-binding protein [Campylobacter coli]EAJ6800351.1 ABC transporter substrate-binding protein [Campylobacter coli]EAK3390214.1 ABC transporter substrate-binding protein [Campylobacter coli]EAL1455661.1 ABC transporter substrate-binding protein [Campylobacter coli]
MKKILLFFIFLGLFKSFLYAKTLQSNENSNLPLISVSIAPQAFFVKKIAGDTLNINILSTNIHKPKSKSNSMKKLEKSELYFTIGLEFEKKLTDKLEQKFPKVKIIDMQENISLAKASSSDSEEILDPFTWLDPILVQNIALNTYNALVQKYPQNKSLYKHNLDKFLTELDVLNLQISSKLQKVKNKEFITYHPAWSYFSKRYNLVQNYEAALEKKLKNEDLKNLGKLIKEKNIKVVFVQTRFPENAAKTLAKECDAKIYKIDHLSYDWENELLKTANAFHENL